MTQCSAHLTPFKQIPVYGFWGFFMGFLNEGPHKKLDKQRDKFLHNIPLNLAELVHLLIRLEAKMCKSGVPDDTSSIQLWLHLSRRSRVSLTVKIHKLDPSSQLEDQLVVGCGWQHRQIAGGSAV